MCTVLVQIRADQERPALLGSLPAVRLGLQCERILGRVVAAEGVESDTRHISVLVDEGRFVVGVLTWVQVVALQQERGYRGGGVVVGVVSSLGNCCGRDVDRVGCIVGSVGGGDEGVVLVNGRGRGGCWGDGWGGDDHPIVVCHVCVCVRESVCVLFATKVNWFMGLELCVWVCGLLYDVWSACIRSRVSEGWMWS